MQNEGEFGLLAILLCYPEDGYSWRAEHCCEVLSARYPEVQASLSDFRERVRPCSLEDLQSLYTETFDLNPVCSLELGWQLFGENYERGEFLVKMRRELQRHHVEESGELPDHLSHALELLDRMEREEAQAFAGACVFPAIGKMRTIMEGKSNPFEFILSAIDRLLEIRYSRPELELSAPQPVFQILN